jgi:hypothetical protein
MSTIEIRLLCSPVALPSTYKPRALKSHSAVPSATHPRTQHSKTPTSSIYPQPATYHTSKPKTPTTPTTKPTTNVHALPNRSPRILPPTHIHIHLRQYAIPRPPPTHNSQQTTQPRSLPHKRHAQARPLQTNPQLHPARPLSTNMRCLQR